MGEERNGWTNGARHGLRFYGRCAQEAWYRSWDAGNAVPPLLALGLLCSGAGLAGVDLSYPGDSAYGTLIGTALFIAATWLAIFLLQFVMAPARLYARLDAELLALTRRLFALPMAPAAALPAPAGTSAHLLPGAFLFLPEPPPIALPLLDAPLLVPASPDLPLPDAPLPAPPSPDLPLLDAPLLVPPLLDLSLLDLSPDDMPSPDLLLLDTPLLTPPLLDLSLLDLSPHDLPSSDLPLLDTPLLVSPLLDLSLLDLRPRDLPSLDPPLLDTPLLVPPLLDLSSIVLPPADLPLVDPSPRDRRPPDLRPFELPALDLPLPGLQSEPHRTARPLARRAPRPVLPTIDVRLHDQVHETTAVDATGHRLPASRAYRARIVNRSDQTVRRCQLFFCNPMNIQVVSGPFDLAPGEHRDLPALRVIDEADEPHALLYFLDAETWHVAQGQAAWLPEPGHFKVKVLSANAPPSALEVELARSAAIPFAWTLVEAAEPDRAPRASRKRFAWASPDAMAEASPGD